MTAAASLLTDTHTHLCDPVFDADRQEAICRAVEAGIGRIITVSEDLVDCRRNLDLAEIYPALRPMAGLYPTKATVDAATEVIDCIRQNRKRLIGIGEVGLDFRAGQDSATRELQQLVFTGFIRLAIELDLPLNVHSRSAGRQAVSMLLKLEARRVQLHAFDGNYGAALPAVAAGYYFSIPPSIIRSRQKQKLVKSLPLSCLLVETDSPVLGPTSDQRNEPANLMVAVDAIAAVKRIPRKQVIEAVCRNYDQLYGDTL